jgi:hypothetical protein
MNNARRFIAILHEQNLVEPSSKLGVQKNGYDLSIVITNFSTATKTVFGKETECKKL